MKHNAKAKAHLAKSEKHAERAHHHAKMAHEMMKGEVAEKPKGKKDTLGRVTKKALKKY